jgi:hypothetical protein
MTNAALPSPREFRWRTLVVLAVLCVLPVLFMAGSQYMDGRENVASQCARALEPEGVADAEVPLLSSSVTAMPAGRLCVYDAADGRTISVQTGWAATGFGLAGSLAVAALTGAALNRGGSDRVILTLLPAALILTIWTIVLFSSHTVVNRP